MPRDEQRSAMSGKRISVQDLLGALDATEPAATAAVPAARGR
jgi:hypothetical protein